MTPTPLEQDSREQLRGWRIHPTATKTLLVLTLAGVAGLAWLPEDLGALRSALQFVGAFAAGMLVSRDAAIWQRIR